MRPEQDVESRIERWLKHDAPAMPEHLRASVMEEVGHKAQYRAGPFHVPHDWRGRHWTAARQLAAGAALLALLFVGAIAVGSRPEPSASPTPSPTLSAAGPFTGTWSTLDVDGSVLLVTFDGTGPGRRVTVIDLRATVCAGDRHIVEGTGTIEGDSLTMTATGGCMGQPLDQPASFSWAYDPTHDVLQMPVEVDVYSGGAYEWVRGSQTDAFEGTWAATDIDGTALTLSFSGSGMSRAVAYHDDHAQFCAGAPGYTAAGSGTIGSVVGDGRFIRVTLDGSCDDGSSPGRSELKYEFDLATGTLIGPLTPLDIGGIRGIDAVVWRRP